jgi:RNA polymerase sigma factor (sigma-70 family)
MRIPIERYRRLSHIALAHTTVSLDSSRDTDHNPREIAASDDRTPDTISLNLAIELLPPRERTVIRSLRAGHTVSEIAAQLGVTPGRISQIKSRAVDMLRRALGIVPASVPHPGTPETRSLERAL